MDEYPSFGPWVKQQRRKLDLTQEALAEQSGCSVEMVRKIEAGTARPSRQLAELLAAGLQVSQDEIPSIVRWARTGGRYESLAAHDGQHTATSATAAATAPPVAGETHLQNPYKGLRAFRETDAPDFFGRETLTARLVERLGESTDLARFLAVVGPSGSGKSSVVRAGLVPALRRAALPTSNGWTVIEVVPGAHPLEELEAAMLRVAVNPPASLLPQLREDERGLLRAAKRVLPGSVGDGATNGDGDPELVLVIDQFEEVFTLVENEEDRRHFLESLFAAVSDPRSPVRVIATLRADFFDRPLLYSRPGELWRQRTEVVLPMAADELERAIVRPAARMGVGLEPDLLAAIVQDVGVSQPGALPLLQYALTELFEQRDRRRGLMTLQAYRASDGVHGALGRRAEAIYSGLDNEEREEARQLFLRLVTLGEGVEDTRRRVRRAEVASAARDEGALERVLDVFGRYRLLTFDRDPLTGGPTVEVAHEALLRSWGRLREWLDSSRESLRVHRRLMAAAAEWNGSGRDRSFLAPGARLAQFEAVAAEGGVAFNAEERDYLQASVADREQQERAEQERRERELALAHQSERTQRVAATRLRYLVGVLVSFLVVAVGLAVFAVGQQGQAATNYTRSEALRLAAESNTLLQVNQAPELAALLSIRSELTQHTPQGDAALEPAAGLEFPLRRFTGHTTSILDAAISPDGKWALTASWDNTALLWDLNTGQEVRRLIGHSDHVAGVAFSPNGKWALTASFDGTGRLWDVATGQEIRRFENGDWVLDVAFSPDGKWALTGAGDKTARLWDVTTGQEIRRFLGHEAAISRVAFSPDGKMVLTGSEDGTARLWNASTGAVIREFASGHGDSVSTVAFSPDGKWVLTGSDDGIARLWDPSKEDEIRRFVGHSGFVNSVAFSPDGKTVLTGGSDNTARTWDAVSGAALRTFAGHTGPVNGALFSPDGKWIFTASWDDDALLWDARSPIDLPQFIGHGAGVTNVAFSPDGKRVLTSSEDNTAQTWDAQTGLPITSFTGNVDRLNSAAFSPDSRSVVTAGGDTTARLYDAQSGVLKLSFIGHKAGVIGVTFSPDGRNLLTGSLDGSARLWNASDGKELHVFGGYKGPVSGITFAPDGKVVYIGSTDSMGGLWDVVTGKEVRRFDDAPSPMYFAVYSPDGKWVLTANEDKTARLWDAATGKPKLTFSGHSGPVVSVAFSPDGNLVLTGSLDKTARLWDLATGQEIRRFAGHTDQINGVAFSPDGKLVLTGSGDNTARLWHVDYHETIHYVCGRLARDFTADERARYALPDDKPTCSQP
jgi:WD40 repeat protein/transcriptional regulator with XRE-family HTH domain